MIGSDKSAPAEFVLYENVPKVNSSRGYDNVVLGDKLDSKKNSRKKNKQNTS